MNVRTNPAGAAVFVDKQYIGTSPAATSFTYYGTREIEVVKDGYQTARVLRTIQPPWYQIPPFDFFSETLWPREIRDERVIDVTMLPEQAATSEELQGRANSLRLQAAQGIATPLPPSAISGIDNGPGGLVGPVLPADSMPVLPPYDPNLPVLPPPTQTAPAGNAPWRPGQILGNFFQPGGQPPQRIPEAGILQGGGYRPEIQP